MAHASVFRHSALASRELSVSARSRRSLSTRGGRSAGPCLGPHPPLSLSAASTCVAGPGRPPSCLSRCRGRPYLHGLLPHASATFSRARPSSTSRPTDGALSSLGVEPQSGELRQTCSLSNTRARLARTAGAESQPRWAASDGLSLVPQAPPPADFPPLEPLRLPGSSASRYERAALPFALPRSPLLPKYQKLAFSYNAAPGGHGAKTTKRGRHARSAALLDLTGAREGSRVCDLDSDPVCFRRGIRARRVCGFQATPPRRSPFLCTAAESHGRLAFFRAPRGGPVSSCSPNQSSTSAPGLQTLASANPAPVGLRCASLSRIVAPASASSCAGSSSSFSTLAKSAAWSSRSASSPREQAADALRLAALAESPAASSPPALANQPRPSSPRAGGDEKLRCSFQNSSTGVSSSQPGSSDPLREATTRKAVSPKRLLSAEREDTPSLPSSRPVQSVPLTPEASAADADSSRESPPSARPSYLAPSSFGASPVVPQFPTAIVSSYGLSAPSAAFLPAPVSSPGGPPRRLSAARASQAEGAAVGAAAAAASARRMVQVCEILQCAEEVDRIFAQGAEKGRGTWFRGRRERAPSRSLLGARRPPAVEGDAFLSYGHAMCAHLARRAAASPAETPAPGPRPELCMNHQFPILANEAIKGLFSRLFHPKQTFARTRRRPDKWLHKARTGRGLRRGALPALWRHRVALESPRRAAHAGEDAARPRRRGCPACDKAVRRPSRSGRLERRGSRRRSSLSPRERWQRRADQATIAMSASPATYPVWSLSLPEGVYKGHPCPSSFPIVVRLERRPQATPTAPETYGRARRRTRRRTKSPPETEGALARPPSPSGPAARVFESAEARVADWTAEEAAGFTPLLVRVTSSTPTSTLCHAALEGSENEKSADASLAQPRDLREDGRGADAPAPGETDRTEGELGAGDRVNDSLTDGAVARSTPVSAQQDMEGNRLPSLTGAQRQDVECRPDDLHVECRKNAAVAEAGEAWRADAAVAASQGGECADMQTDREGLPASQGSPDVAGCPATAAQRIRDARGLSSDSASDVLSASRERPTSGMPADVARAADAVDVPVSLAQAPSFPATQPPEIAPAFPFGADDPTKAANEGRDRVGTERGGKTTEGSCAVSRGRKQTHASLASPSAAADKRGPRSGDEPMWPTWRGGSLPQQLENLFVASAQSLHVWLAAFPTLQRLCDRAGRCFASVRARVGEWCFQNGNVLITTGSVLSLTGTVMADMRLLRGFNLLAGVCFFSYNCSRRPPVRDAATWNIVFFSLNFFMLYRYLTEHNEVGFTNEELDVFEKYFLPAGLSPRRFRTLLTIGQWETLPAGTEITRPGDPVTTLVFVVRGRVDVFQHGDLLERYDGGDRHPVIGLEAFLSYVSALRRLAALGESKKSKPSAGTAGASASDSLSAASLLPAARRAQTLEGAGQLAPQCVGPPGLPAQSWRAQTGFDGSSAVAFDAATNAGVALAAGAACSAGSLGRGKGGLGSGGTRVGRGGAGPSNEALESAAATGFAVAPGDGQDEKEDEEEEDGLLLPPLKAEVGTVPESGAAEAAAGPTCHTLPSYVDEAALVPEEEEDDEEEDEAIWSRLIRSGRRRNVRGMLREEEEARSTQEKEIAESLKSGRASDRRAVCSTDCDVLVFDIETAARFILDDPVKIGFPVLQGLASVLVERSYAESSRLAISSYDSVLAGVLSDGSVQAEERQFLEEWRTRRGISEAQHVEALHRFGWSAEEFDRGERAGSDVGVTTKVGRALYSVVTLGFLRSGEDSAVPSGEEANDKNPQAAQSPEDARQDEQMKQAAGASPAQVGPRLEAAPPVAEKGGKVTEDAQGLSRPGSQVDRTAQIPGELGGRPSRSRVGLPGERDQAPSGTASLRLEGLQRGTDGASADRGAPMPDCQKSSTANTESRVLERRAIGGVGGYTA
ncbi:hypothetical protein BESB_065700 [Besnoitia besnoiti]|uniref:Cyclic nucleotide-binding domain-containing protein n=1 Tax=Besnoitia besnoiti TaxID=94643 RepID=A0A2A9MG11_BESBE|nr:hypothetical protein BESB_065700 [Besnoitia besnoiti]PFH34537.1 hypothetical protein BESB_065700 [Besnoitia besnoiti]